VIPIEEICYYKKADKLHLFIMTAVLAIKETETSILMAADTQATEDGDIRLKENKIFKHPKEKLAWSYSGNVGEITFRFNEWLESKGDSLTWNTIIQEGAGVFAAINSKLRNLAQTATGKCEINDLADCLIVGFLEKPDKPDIIELSSTGKVTSYWQKKFHAIGAKLPAYSIYETLNRISPQYSPLQKIETIMNIMTDILVVCGKPCNTCRITPTEIEEVRLNNITPKI
jgi:20S proteasome alpha/beta subunit